MPKKEWNGRARFKKARKAKRNQTRGNGTTQETKGNRIYGAYSITLHLGLALCPGLPLPHNRTRCLKLDKTQPHRPPRNNHKPPRSPRRELRQAARRQRIEGVNETVREVQRAVGYREEAVGQHEEVIGRRRWRRRKRRLCGGSERYKGGKRRPRN